MCICFNASSICQNKDIQQIHFLNIIKIKLNKTKYKTHICVPLFSFIVIYSFCCFPFCSVCSWKNQLEADFDAQNLFFHQKTKTTSFFIRTESRRQKWFKLLQTITFNLRLSLTSAIISFISVIRPKQFNLIWQWLINDANEPSSAPPPSNTP